MYTFLFCLIFSVKFVLLFIFVVKCWGNLLFLLKILSLLSFNFFKCALLLTVWFFSFAENLKKLKIIYLHDIPKKESLIKSLFSKATV